MTIYLFNVFVFGAGAAAGLWTNDFVVALSATGASAGWFVAYLESL